MEVKVLEIRDEGTFIPVVCIRPVAENDAQRYLLRRDGYNASAKEHCIILVQNQCYGVSYDPYNWASTTMRLAHHHIEKNWANLQDGDVVDVEYITGKSQVMKRSERFTAPI